MLYRQMNEDDLAYSTLKKMYEMYPDDYDITLAMSAQHMKKAEKLMELGLYAEALPHVLFVSQKHVDDNEVNGAAWEKALSCYINMKRYNEALATLDTITLHFPDYENGTLKGHLFSIKWIKPKRLCNCIYLPSSRAMRICAFSMLSDTRN